jgi:hypothetical protein
MIEKNLTVFAAEGRSELMEAVMDELRLFEETEVAQAIDASVEGEQRAYACGKASALGEFRQHLLDLRRQAMGEREMLALPSKAVNK